MRDFYAHQHATGSLFIAEGEGGTRADGCVVLRRQLEKCCVFAGTVSAVEAERMMRDGPKKRRGKR